MITMTLIGGQETVARFSGMSKKIYDDLLKTIQTEWYGLQSYIVTTKLSGQVLKRRTGLLASSINVGGPETATQFIADAAQITGKVGTKVVYGAVHEYGGTFHIPAHERIMDARTSAVRAYDAHFPERSFLRSGLQDRQAQIRAAIQETYERNMRMLSSGT